MGRFAGVALAGKTFSVQRHRLVFEGDERVRATPKARPFQDSYGSGSV